MHKTLIMNRYIRIITAIGLIAIVLVQFIWLSSSYQAIKNNLVRESNILFKEAVDREVFDGEGGTDWLGTPSQGFHYF